jgi:hypothetical protein
LEFILGRSIKKNPTKILSVSVDFRNSKGRFTKPHLATKFIVKIAGEKIEFDVPRFRPKTKKKVLAYAAEVVYELKLFFYGSEVERIERRTLEKPKRVQKKPVKVVSYKREISDYEYFSRKDQKVYRMLSFYYWFKVPYQIDRRSAASVMKIVYGFMYKKGLEVIKKYELRKKWKFRMKVVGGGEYMRQRTATPDNPSGLVADIFGFSGMRASVPPKDEYFAYEVKDQYQRFMEKVVSEKSRIGSYFSRLTDKQIEQNGYQRVLFVHGIKLEFVKEV